MTLNNQQLNVCHQMDVEICNLLLRTLSFCSLTNGKALGSLDIHFPNNNKNYLIIIKFNLAYKPLAETKIITNYKK